MKWEAKLSIDYIIDQIDFFLSKYLPIGRYVFKEYK